jgi:hypothetical protein
MENKQIKIEAPIGFEIDKDKSSFELIVFKPKAIDKTKEMSDFLFTILSKTESKITNEKEITHYIIGTDEWLIQQDWKNGRLWVRYSLIWQIFESRFGLKYGEIRDFIGSWVETNLGWNGLTPQTEHIFII